MWKLDPRAFLPEGRGANLWDATFFSLTTITTIGLSELRPHTGLAQALAAIELFAGLGTLSLLALSFSTLLSADIEAARKLADNLSDFVRGEATSVMNDLAAIALVVQAGAYQALLAAYHEQDASNLADRWAGALEKMRAAEPRSLGANATSQSAAASKGQFGGAKLGTARNALRRRKEERGAAGSAQEGTHRTE